MSKKKYLLSICIPTYNREKYLKKLIDSIILQKSFTKDISIIINDGPSKDNTKELALEYQKKYKNIFYSRNKKAVGMLPAILESINMSNGEYTWIFGSDDFMQEKSLKIVLDLIKKSNPTLILSNRYGFENENKYKSNNVSKKKILYFQGFSDFSTYIGLSNKENFEDKHSYFTFMSVYCFNTNYFKESYNITIKNICSENKLKKHYFNYILILFSQLYVKNLICVIESPKLVFCKLSNHNWKHSKKIYKDIKMLGKFLNTHYQTSKDFKKIFNNFIFIWKSSYILTPFISLTKKMKLYNILSFFWRKFILKIFK